MAVVETADPASALPLKRLQGALSLMATMFSKLGNLMTSTLPKLLTILLTVCGHVTGLLERRERIAAKHWSQLRNLRNVCLERVAQFFSKFQRYPWSPMELEAVFHACVWPQAHLLAVEAIHTPTPLLRLFQVWAENPRSVTYICVVVLSVINGEMLVFTQVLCPVRQAASRESGGSTGPVDGASDGR